MAGSDTHQATQYGCIRTNFANEANTFRAIYGAMQAGRYTIEVHSEAAFKVKTAGILKRALKEVHALGGDYVRVLLWHGETEAVLEAKRRATG